MNNDIHTIYSNITNVVNFQKNNPSAINQLIAFQKGILNNFLLPNPYEGSTTEFIEDFSVKLIKNILNTTFSDPTLINNLTLVLENYARILIIMFDQPNFSFIGEASKIANPDNAFYTTLTKKNQPIPQYTKIANILKTPTFYEKITHFFLENDTLSLEHISILIDLLASTKEKTEIYIDSINFIFQKTVSIFKAYKYDDLRKIDDKIMNSTLDLMHTLETSFLSSLISLQFQIETNIRFAKSDILEKRFNGLSKIVSIIKNSQGKLHVQIVGIVKDAKVIDSILNDFHNQLVNPFISILIEFIQNKIDVQTYLVAFWKVSVNQNSSVAPEFFNGWKSLIADQHVKKTIFDQYTCALFDEIAISLNFPESSFSFLDEISVYAHETQKEQVFNSLLLFSSSQNPNMKLVKETILHYMPKNDEKIMEKSLDMIKNNFLIQLATSFIINLKLNSAKSDSFLNALLNVLNDDNSIKTIDLVYRLLKQIGHFLDQNQFGKILDIYLHRLKTDPETVSTFFIDILAISNTNKGIFTIEMKADLYKTICEFKEIDDALIPLILQLFDSLNINDKTKNMGIEVLWDIAFRTRKRSVMLFLQNRLKTIEYIETCMKNIKNPGSLDCLYQILIIVEPYMNNHIRWILKMPLVNKYIDNDYTIPVNIIGCIEMTISLTKGTTYGSLKFFLSLFLKEDANNLLLCVNGSNVSKLDDRISTQVTVEVKEKNSNQQKLQFDIYSRIPSLILFSNDSYTLSLMGLLEDQQLGECVLKILNKIPTLSTFTISFDIDEDGQIEGRNKFKNCNWDWNQFLSFDEPNHLIYHLNTIGNHLCQSDIEWIRWFFNTGGAFKLMNMMLKAKGSLFDFTCNSSQRKFTDREFLLLLLIIHKMIQLEVVEEINDIIEKIDNETLTSFLNYSSHLVSYEDADDVAYYLLLIIKTITDKIGIKEEKEVIDSYVHLFSLSCFHENKKIQKVAMDFVQGKEIQKHNIMIQLIPNAIHNNNSEFINSILSLANESSDKELIWNILLDSTLQYFSPLKNKEEESIWKNLNTSYPNDEFIQSLLSLFMYLIESFQCKEKDQNENSEIHRIDELYFFLLDVILYNQLIYFKITSKLINLLYIIIHLKPSLIDETIPRILTIQTEMRQMSKDIINNKSIQHKISTIENYNGPTNHIKGLKNLGATCYMNSLLQQLYSIPFFRESLLNLNVEYHENENSNSNNASTESIENTETNSTTTANNNNNENSNSNNASTESIENTEANSTTENNNNNNENSNSNNLTESNENGVISEDNNNNENSNNNSTETSNNYNSESENNASKTTTESNDNINENNSNEESSISNNNGNTSTENNDNESNSNCQNDSGNSNRNEDDYKWLFELQYLFLKMLLYPTSSPSIDPSNFIHEFRDIEGNKISSYQQQDAEEFLSLLLSRLEPKLPAIDTLFKGKIENHTQGEFQYKNYTHNYIEEYFDISLEVKGHKNIASSFEAYKTPDRFEGQNKFKTEELGSIDATQTHLILEPSPILIITLKRFQFNMTAFVKEKINSRYEFPLSLDISPILVKGEKMMYELYGVIIHKGTADAGHYISHIKGVDNKWRIFNDAHVQIEKVDEMKNACYGVNDSSKESYNGNAYILFYRQVDYDFNNKNLPVSSQLLKRLAEDIKKDILTEISLSEEYFMFITSIIQDPEILFSLLSSDSGISSACHTIIKNLCLDKCKSKEFADSILSYFIDKSFEYITNDDSSQDKITNITLIDLVKAAITSSIVPNSEKKDFLDKLILKLKEVDPNDLKETKLDIYVKNITLFYEIIDNDNQIDTSEYVSILFDFISKNQQQDIGSIINLLIKMDKNKKDGISQSIANYFTDERLLNYLIKYESKEILTMFIQRIKNDPTMINMLFKLNPKEITNLDMFGKMFICILSSNIFKPQDYSMLKEYEDKNYIEIFFAMFLLEFNKEKIMSIFEYVLSMIPYFIDYTFDSFIYYSDFLIEKLVFSSAFDVRRVTCSIFLKYIFADKEAKISKDSLQRSLFNIYSSLIKRIDLLEKYTISKLKEKISYNDAQNALQVEHYFYLLSNIVSIGHLNNNVLIQGDNLAKFLINTTPLFSIYNEPCFIRKIVIDFIIETVSSENSTEFFGKKGEVLHLFTKGIPFFTQSYYYSKKDLNELETYADSYIKFIVLIPINIFHIISTTYFLAEILKSTKFIQSKFSQELYEKLCKYLDAQDVDVVSNFSRFFFSDCLPCHLEEGRLIPIKIGIHIMKKYPELTSTFYTNNFYQSVWSLIHKKITEYTDVMAKNKLPVDTSVFPLMNLLGVFNTQFSSVLENKNDTMWRRSNYKELSAFFENRIFNPAIIFQFSLLNKESASNNDSFNSKGSFVFMQSLFSLNCPKKYEPIYKAILPFLQENDGFLSRVPKKAKYAATQLLIVVLHWAKKFVSTLGNEEFANIIFKEFSCFIKYVYQRDTLTSKSVLIKERSKDCETLNRLAKQVRIYFNYAKDKIITDLLQSFNLLVSYEDGIFYFTTKEIVSVCIDLFKMKNIAPFDWIRNTQKHILNIIEKDYSKENINAFIISAKVIDEVIEQFGIKDIPKIQMSQQEKENQEHWATIAQSGTTNGDEFILMHLFTILVPE